MYTVIILILVAIALGLLSWGARNRRPSIAALGALVGVFTIAFFWFLDFWAEKLWFDALGYESRFWKVFLARFGFTLVGAVAGLLGVFLLTLPLPKKHGRMHYLWLGLGALIGGQWGFAKWDTFLTYINRVSTGFTDPILNKDTGFYLFSLPFYSSVYGLLMLIAIVSLASVIVTVFVQFEAGEIEWRQPSDSQQERARGYRSLYFVVGILFFILAIGKYLDRFQIMYSEQGAVHGAGWTDVNILLPAYAIVIVISVLFGIFLLTPPLQSWVRKKVFGAGVPENYRRLGVLVGSSVALGVIWFFALSLVPQMIQWLRVEPNEITFERPYIKNNIEYTRHGFNVHKVEERQFPVSDDLTKETVEQNQSVLSNIRLWDWRALISVYQQFQEIRLYYEFQDVDIDRYRFQDDYRQMMVSTRELALGNLPSQSQTFVNRVFKYTHGNGITMAPVNEFTPQGLPNMYLKNIPPESSVPELEVEKPQIYYGEMASSHAVVNSKEEEFDYPSGDENVYMRYPGSGGVQLSNIWRKFLYGWKFDGTRFFLSGYPTKESRIMFRRQIRDRVSELAPFLQLDDDPYIVLADGELYWIMDAYTTSQKYPYSEPFFSGGMTRRGLRQTPGPFTAGSGSSRINYIRNSVKVVVNAFDGSVDFYMFEEDDPLIRVWNKVFPGLLKKREEMPESLRSHVRYPVDMMLVQGLVYAKYHMTDPTVFYNQEDLWVRATEKYYNRSQPVEPYYIMWEPPDSDELEFVLMLPFTPKKRDVMIGWIAGMCDDENYGRLLGYKFPKEKRVLGPQQVETKIDQDSFLSGQLSLWDQRGSNVLRGNVLVIPVEDTLIYVEPIYLKSETAAYPELRLVAVMHNDDLSYAESFDEALKQLFGEAPRPKAPIAAEGERSMRTRAQLIRDAKGEFDRYLEQMGQKQYEDAAKSLKQLEQLLNQLEGEAAPEQQPLQPEGGGETQNESPAIEQ